LCKRRRFNIFQSRFGVLVEELNPSILVNYFAEYLEAMSIIIEKVSSVLYVFFIAAMDQAQADAFAFRTGMLERNDTSNVLALLCYANQNQN
jgi:S-methylmethionine-dependent homocysteine/selenocysteine methylase